MTGYVESMKAQLFGLTRTELQTMAQTQIPSNIPEPLNWQFPDRVGKRNEVNAYENSQRKIVPTLYPPGMQVKD